LAGGVAQPLHHAGEGGRTESIRYASLGYREDTEGEGTNGRRGEDPEDVNLGLPKRSPQVYYKYSPSEGKSRIISQGSREGHTRKPELRDDNKVSPPLWFNRSKGGPFGNARAVRADHVKPNPQMA